MLKSEFGIRNSECHRAAHIASFEFSVLSVEFSGISTPGGREKRKLVAAAED